MRFRPRWRGAGSSATSGEFVRGSSVQDGSNANRETGSQKQCIERDNTTGPASFAAHARERCEIGEQAPLEVAIATLLYNQRPL